MGDVALVVGAIAMALAVSVAMLVRAQRTRAAGLAIALVLAAVLLTADAWDDQRFEDLRDSPLALGLAAVGFAALVGGLAVLFRRHRAALPLVAVAALPFRIPIEAGGESANLLVPLYVVIAAGTAAAVMEAYSSRAVAEPEERLPGGLPGSAARWLPLVVAASVVLYAVQSSYSPDLPNALKNLCFFYVPFGVLFTLLLGVDWNRWLLAGVFGVAVGEAVVFALVGFVEYAVRDLLWNPQVETANVFHPYFRVNSLFWDPNILARYLAVTAVGTTAVMLWTRSTRLALAAAAGFLAMLATIAITFSQSGLLALLAGLVVLAALRWSARWTLAACGAVALAAVALALAGGASPDLSLDSKRLDEETSGRGELIRGGLDLAADRPLTGWGSGSFERKFGRRFGADTEAAVTASHTEPVTILAEQGAIGLALYLVLLATATTALLGGLGPLAPGLRGFRAAPGRDPPGSDLERNALAIARVGVLAAFVAMLVHSLSYAAFLTDPITWALLAIGLALVRSPLPAVGPQPVRGNERATPAGARA
jgi:putative inorganic carbon (hco3(-)) transporter